MITATIENNEAKMLTVLTEKLPCTVSNVCFADDLDTIASVIAEYGFDATARDLHEKAQAIRNVVSQFQVCDKQPQLPFEIR